MSCSNCCPLQQCNSTFTASPEPCYPTADYTVIPSYGGNGYYCDMQGGVMCGYRTLGNYGNSGNCCNPQIVPICPTPCGPAPQPAPQPAPPRRRPSPAPMRRPSPAPMRRPSPAPMRRPSPAPMRR